MNQGTLQDTIRDLRSKFARRDPFELMVWDVFDFAAGESHDWASWTAQEVRGS